NRNVGLHEIVVGVVQRDSSLEVFQFLGKRIREPCQAAAVHPQRDSRQWTLLDSVTSREFSEISAACDRAMTSGDHHEWVSSAADKVVLSGDTLWQAMCAEWASNCLSDTEADTIIRPIRE